MSKRTDVLFALKAMIQRALPGARVIGLDGTDAAPQQVPATGMVIVRSGDPGEPEVDLSPLTYWFEHRIPLELSAFQSGALTSEQAVDVMMTAIGVEIERDRTLGGLCHWLEASAPLTEDIYVESGSRPPRGADAVVTATYGTHNPFA